MLILPGKAHNKRKVGPHKLINGPAVALLYASGKALLLGVTKQRPVAYFVKIGIEWCFLLIIHTLWGYFSSPDSISNCATSSGVLKSMPSINSSSVNSIASARACSSV